MATLARVVGRFNGKLYARNTGLRNQVVPSLQKSIWVHAASLGEFEQGKKVIDGLREKYPDRSLVLTFFSSSGYERRKEYPGVDHVLYLPYDTEESMSRFVDLLRPALVIIIKYEFWFTLLSILRRKSIPYMFISSVFREDQYFFKKGFGPFRELLKGAVRIFVQNEASKQLLKKWEFKNVVLAGDTRVDRALEIRAESFSSEILDAWKQDKFCVVAGSTWPVDEDLFVKAIPGFKEWKWIFAPHEVYQEHIAALLHLFGDRAITFSQAERGLNSENREWIMKSILIVDRIGMLSRLYRYGDLAYVGGGFGAGIHNTLEPAVYGLPVIFGPRHGKFQEAEDFLEAGVARSVGDLRKTNLSKVSHELSDALSFFSDADRREMVRRDLNMYFIKNSGATQYILKEIKYILK